MTVVDPNTTNHNQVRTATKSNSSGANTGTDQNSNNFNKLMGFQGGVNINTGSGDDVIVINGQPNGYYNVDTGSGDDTVIFGPPAQTPDAESEGPVAANERGQIFTQNGNLVNRDGYNTNQIFQGGDGGRYDIHGEAGKSYNLFADSGVQLNGLFEQFDDNGTCIGKTGLTVTGPDGETSEIAFNKDGTATINGEPMELGKTYTLADGGTATLTGQGDGYNTLSVTTAEGYTIDQSSIPPTPEDPNGGHINVDVHTGADGVDNGQMPSGLLGQSFDADDAAREGKIGDGAQGEGAIDGTVQDYEVDTLFASEADDSVENPETDDSVENPETDDSVAPSENEDPNVHQFDDESDLEAHKDANGAVNLTYGSDDDTVIVDASTDGPLNIRTGSGDDTIIINGDITGPLNIDTGSGDDTIIINGQVYQPQIGTGSGDDTVIINGQAFAPVAANEHSNMWGPSHFMGGDGGLYEFQGEEGKIYDFLSDSGLELRGRFDAWGDDGDTVVGETGLTVGEGLDSNNINFKKDGTALIDGQPMEEGKEYELADGGTAKLVDGALTVTTGEGYTIRQTAHRSGEEAFISVDVSTGEKGVDNGQLPGGLMGESFDADDQTLAGATGEPGAYEVSALDPMNDDRSTEEVEDEASTTQEVDGNPAITSETQRYMEYARAAMQSDEE